MPVLVEVSTPTDRPVTITDDRGAVLVRGVAPYTAKIPAQHITVSAEGWRPLDFDLSPRMTRAFVREDRSIGDGWRNFYAEFSYPRDDEARRLLIAKMAALTAPSAGLFDPTVNIGANTATPTSPWLAVSAGAGLLVATVALLNYLDHRKPHR